MIQAWYVALGGLALWGAVCLGLVVFVWSCRGVKAPTSPESEAQS
jgi:hypothetical protein